MDKELLARIDERQQVMTEKLELIYGEVKKTNGRVTQLENWRSKVKGMYAALIIAGPVIGAIITWIIQITTSK